MIGQCVAHYKILEKLGEGGMGVVYKAEDTKLKRTVALKFLPPELTRDLQAKKRFLQEAQAAAALDHPNICTIHEISEVEGRMFIVMNYVKGQSLKERIALSPMKLEEALDISTQVAEGLRAAHEKLLKLMIPNQQKYSSLLRKFMADIVFMNNLKGKLELV